MRHAVEVNEGAVEITQQGIRWWSMFRAYLCDRIRETKPGCIVSGKVEVDCESQDHAAWLAEHMVKAGGLPRTAVKVVKVKCEEPR